MYGICDYNEFINYIESTSFGYLRMVRVEDNKDKFKSHFQDDILNYSITQVDDVVINVYITLLNLDFYYKHICIYVSVNNTIKYYSDCIGISDMDEENPIAFMSRMIQLEFGSMIRDYNIDRINSKI